MSAAICVAGSTTQSAGFAQGTTSFLFLGDADASHLTVEPQAQTIFRTAGTFSSFAALVRANTVSVSTTYQFRKNTGNGNETFTVGASATGEFVDSNDKDSVVSADLVTLEQAIGAGSGTLTYGATNLIFASSDGATTKRIVTDVATPGHTNTSFPFCLTGTASSGPTEAQIQSKVEMGGTAKNYFCVIVNNNINGSSSLVFRQNGTSTALGSGTIGANATGTFEDTGDQITVNAGDLINSLWATPSATTGLATTGGSGFDFTSNSNQFLLACTSALNSPTSVNASANGFYSVGGGATQSNTATESNVALTSRLAFTANNLGCNIKANTVTGSSTVGLRQGGVTSVLKASVTGSTTGIFEDKADSISIAATDKINHVLAAGAGGTSISMMGVWMVGTGSSHNPVLYFGINTLID